MLDDLWKALLENWSTTLVAVFVAFVAWQQYKVARNRLKFDLFERRMKLYDASRKFIRVVKGRSDLTELDVHEFHAESRNAKWLLDDQLAKYLEQELWGKVIDFINLDKEFEGLQGTERSISIQKQRELIDWFEAQEPVIDEKFAPYLKLRH